MIALSILNSCCSLIVPSCCCVTTSFGVREKKAHRLRSTIIQERSRSDDRVVIVGHGLVAALSVLSSGAALLMSSSSSPGIVEIVLFTISCLQGPFVIYQRLRLIKSKSIKEETEALQNRAKKLKRMNSQLEADISAMESNLTRLNDTLDRYESFIDGHRLSSITRLNHENNTINNEKKLTEEAIRMQELAASILRADLDNNRHVDDFELKVLALSIEYIEGVPFSSQELREQFKKKKDEYNKSLRHLADTIRTLYVEKRHQQHHTSTTDEFGNSPHMLSVPMPWKRNVHAAYAA